MIYVLLNFNLRRVEKTNLYKIPAMLMMLSWVMLGSFSYACNSAIPLNPTSSSPTCVAGNANFFASGGFSTYHWTGPNGFSSNLQNPTITNATTAMAGVYTVVGTDASSCTASATVTLVVNVNVQTPAEIGYPESNCGAYTGQTLQMVVAPSGGTGTTEYVWMKSNIGNLLEMVAGANGTSYAPGTVNHTTYYRFCVRSQGCSEFKEGAIVKKEVLAAADVTASNTGAYCSSSSIQLSANSSDDNLVTDGSFTSEVAGKFIYAYSASPGDGLFYHTNNATDWGLSACSDHTGGGKMLIFDGYPFPDVKAWEYSTPVLANKTYTFSIWASSLSAINPASLKLSVNGVTINTAVTLPTTTCQWVQISATWNSGANTSAEIAILNETATSAGNDFAIDDIAFYTTGNYSWVGPNGFTSTAQNPTIAAATLANGGTYTVTYTKGNGCIDVATTDVTVNACPANCTSVAISTLPSICEGDNLHLFASGGNTYNWAGPNGFTSTLQNPSLTNATTAMAGTYSVTVTGDAACTASTSASVSINTRPATPTTADAAVCGYAAASLSASGCAGGTLSWYASGNNNILAGTGATYTTPILYEAAAYYVDCTVNGCKSSQAVSHVLLNQVNVAIVNPLLSYCKLQTYDFEAENAGTSVTYLWDFGAGAVPATANTRIVNGVYWTTTGSKTVTLTVTNTLNGCSETLYELYDVYDAPTADVSMSAGTTPTCVGGNVVLSTPNTVGWTYKWYKDNVLIPAATSPTYSVPTTTTGSHNYSVEVTNTSGCSVIDSQRIVVNTSIAILALNDAPTCAGSDVHFTVTGANSYTWTGPNGFSAASQNPNIFNASALATGTYSISITDMSGCTASTTTNVVVNNCGTVVNSCVLGNGHDEWAGFPTFPLAWAMGGVGETYLIDGGVTLKEYSNGNVIINGTLKGNGDPIVNPSGTDSNKKYAFSITLGQKENWANWSAGGGTPFYPIGQNPPYNTWSYYLLNTGTMIGLGANNGHSLTLTHYPSNSSKGFQQGYGANYHEPDNGIGGWTTFLRSSDNATGVGDFIFVSTCTCPSFSPEIVGNNYVCSKPTTLTATGGEAVYWSTGSTNMNITVTNAGVYSAIISDGGCSDSVSVTVVSKGIIGYYVWNDENRDGIQDPAEKGVAGVNVTLYNSVTNQIVASTSTDAYGQYLFDCLEMGSYKVKFSLPLDYTFSPKYQGNDADLDSDVNPATGFTDVITLLSGQQVSAVDAGIYYANPQHEVIGDYVWLDSDADGLQDNNEVGISGVTVALYDNTTGELIMTTLTNASGKYQFSDVGAGAYRIGVTLPLGLVATTPHSGGDTNLDSDLNPLTHKIEVIVLNAFEQNLSFDIGLVPQNALKAWIGDYVWNDINVNGLQDSDERGVSGITVELRDDAGNIVQTTETDIFGKYVFNNVTQGFYLLRLNNMPVNWTFSPRNQGTNDDIDSDLIIASGLTDTLRIYEGDRISNIDFGIYETTNTSNGILGDFVWYDKNINGLQDAGEVGVAGVNVTLYNFANLPIASATTNQSGYYKFTGLGAGTYSVGFSNLPTDFMFTTKNAGADTQIDSDADMITGKTANIVLTAAQNNFSLDAGIFLNDKNVGYASIGDKVWEDMNNNGIQDVSEDGVQNILVQLYDANGTLVATTKTDANGYYNFTFLQKGNYQVAFSNIPAGYTYSPQYQTTNINLDSDVDATGTTPLFFLLEGENNLSIDAGIYKTLNANVIGDFVWNDQNQDGLQDAGEIGIPGVTVTIYSNADVFVASTTTDERGKYMFSNIIDGTYYLSFTNIPNGYNFTAKAQSADFTKDSDVNELTGKTDAFSISGLSTNYDIDAGLFSNTHAILGDYVWADDGDGMQEFGELPLSGITVRLYSGSQLVAQTVTNENGFYLFVNLIPDNNYTVNFTTIANNAQFSPKNATVSDKDSDVNPSTATTDVFALAAGQQNLDVDAGVVLASLVNGAICGDTWIDTNADGIQNNSEKYIGGLMATLLDASLTPVSVTISNASGKYCFDNVSLGAYTVRFSLLPLGTAFTLVDVGDDNFDSDANPSNATSNAAYSIVAGQKVEGPDAGMLPPASVAGIAFEDNGANPNGLHDATEPNIPNVLVTLYDENDAVLRTILTDKKGAYIFTGLVAANYKVGFGSVSGRAYTGQDAGGNDNLDSDVNAQGKTDLFSLVVNQNKINVDAGYLQQGIVFPVELRYFSAEWLNGDGLLKWGTVNEVNVSHFEIWRSLDEVSFERIIDKIPTKGNGGNQNYSAFDFRVGAINTDKVYYRLKMVDKDGEAATSKTIELTLNRITPTIYCNIYPNPARNDIWFDYQLFDVSQAELQLINAEGALVFKASLASQVNITQYHIDVQTLARGVYYLKIQTEDASVVQKVILE